MKVILQLLGGFSRSNIGEEELPILGVRYMIKSKEFVLVYCIFNSNIGNIADGLGLLEMIPTAA